VSRPGPDSRGDGDGWVDCADGHRHWGRFGAAGLLLHRPGQPDPGTLEVLLQHRATWSHHGGTWGLLGGARHSDESPVAGALREAAEEGGLDPAAVAVHGQYDDAHGGWSYVTVLGGTRRSTDTRPTGGESIDVEWVPVADVTARPLHPGFARTWPLLRGALRPLTVVVDAANVVGSRPDGWWRDRAGAARRLVEGVAALAPAGLADTDLPDGVDLVPLTRRRPSWVLVVEGAARPAADDPPVGVEVRAAPGSGDDEIVAALRLRDATAGPVVVVTADRALADRCRALGATVVGPRWLLSLVHES
jgi:8-oxo-dGTP diphosphatase